MNDRTSKDYYPYILISLIAFTLLLLILLDRRIPVFSSPSSMVPFIFIVFSIALILARHSSNQNTSRNVLPDKLWLPWYRIGLVGGALMGPIFLINYWAYDWPTPNRVALSERRVQEICALSHSVPPEYVQVGTPDLISLVPFCLTISVAIGLGVGILFPSWHDQLNKLANRWPVLTMISSPYPSGLVFGIIFGALVGTWLCPYFFSQDDGRPLIRISTCAVSSFMSIGFCLLFEIAKHRNVMTKPCYLALTNVLIVGAILTGVVWLFDTQIGFSENSYCLFYAGWDTELNELKQSWEPIVAGALYGGMIGGIVMSVASGYLVIRTIIHTFFSSQ